jgi:hypothetical protein
VYAGGHSVEVVCAPDKPFRSVKTVPSRQALSARDKLERNLEGLVMREQDINDDAERELMVRTIASGCALRAMVKKDIARRLAKMMTRPAVVNILWGRWRSE